MFDIGWVEMMVVIIVMVVVIGPKDLPGVLHTIGKWISQMRAMGRHFQENIEEMARDSGVDGVRDEMNALRDFRMDEEIEKAIDPKGELADGINADAQTDKDDVEAIAGPSEKSQDAPAPKKDKTGTPEEKA
ncbi:MAG: twin-arginine translocase subunit TatB [Rhodospirillales bacterium]|jgi:sec-independent protein translocase protein TatB|nr:twin-arginine translocase subunit TatB [Rhodospirillales bacterium]MBT4006988.1 twin-arginine translocase subunit TatB [Rhodospirillales bacterium]MBT5076033.1 twin-arginine translocase subunit TatB [Rhodospirillales bacterium]MBT5112848.1 twin-arginine translocase subunit TatB [Rhodospirillales bacterium]MBT5673619.1 twin-arginine translocase subunit TatB [Rhodospirillales bacterium]